MKIESSQLFPGASSRRSIAAFSVAALAVLLFAGNAAAEDVDAAKLWTKHCQTCHGPDGKGKTKAGEKAKVKDLTSAEVKAKLTKDKAIKSMTDGVKEEGSDKLAMKSFKEKLSEAEMAALADYAMQLK